MKLKSKYVFLFIGILSYIFFSYKPVKIDLTEDKRFTLDTSSKQLIQNLNDEIFCDVYLCGDMSIHFRKLQNQLFDLIQNVKNNSKTHIFVKEIDIQTLDKNERETTLKKLNQLGLFATNMMQVEKGKRVSHVIYPFVVLKSKNGKEIGVNLLSSNKTLSQEEIIKKSIENLEYNFVNGIKLLVNTKKTKISMVTGHNEPLDARTFSLIDTLKSNYDLSFIKLDKNTLNIGTQALIILKPTEKFTEEEKFILDQFIMRGGKVLFFIDRMKTNVEEMLGGKAFAIVQDLNLDDMFFKYGVRVEYSLIKDLQCGVYPIVTGNIGNQPQITLMTIPFLVLANANNNHVVSKNLNQVYAKFSSKISPINTPDIKHTPLLFSSFYSYCVGNPVIFDLNELKHEPDREIYCKGPIPIAYLMEGNFLSLYKGRMAPENLEFIEKKDAGYSKVLVASSGDILLNFVAPKQKQVLPLGMDPFIQEQFANQDFILSALSYMVDEVGLINAKNKNYKIHLLDNKIVAEYSLLIQITNILLPLFLNFLIAIIFYMKKKRGIFIFKD